MGKFKFTSTPRGAKPRRADLIRTIRRGAKGTSMPSFRWLSERDLQAVIDYVILLSQRGELEQQLIEEAEFELDEDDDFDPEVIAEFADRIAQSWDDAAGAIVRPVTPMPAMTDETIALGRKAFLSQGCAKCHGEDGRGQTIWLSPRFLAEQEALPESKREEINRDDWGNVAPAADLTSGMLHGGRRPVDIYRRIYSGINGTPMPAFANLLRDEPDTIWHLVHYVLSIVEGREISSSDQATTGPHPDTYAAHMR
jgi:mono/diheme cytochrome c family protein